MNLKLLCASTAVLTGLGGCFGGDRDDAVAQDLTRVPASALVSSTAYTAFVAGVVDGQDTELLLLDDLTVPQSETALPIPVL